MQLILNIDENLLNKAVVMTGITEKSALICEGLKSLIYLKSSARLAQLGGTEPDLEAVPRRREEDD